MSKKKERNWLDDLHEGASVIITISHELEAIARALNMVGNKILAKDLSKMSAELHASATQLRRVGVVVLDEQSERSNELTDTILMSVIADRAVKGLKTTKKGA